MDAHRLRGLFKGLATVVIGIFILGKVFDFIDLSWGKLVLGLIAFYIIFEGVARIADSKKSNYDADSWQKYDPNYMPPPPPPPNFEEVKEETTNNNNYWSEQKEKAAFNKDAKYDYGAYNSNEYDKIYKSTFIGDFKYKEAYWQLKPMELSAFIGDAHLDLTRAQIPFGETKIDFSAFIGDMKIFVPNDPSIGVKVNLNAFIGETKFMKDTEGGFLTNHQMETPHYHECDRRIVINVSTFIGDVKVKRIG